MKINMKNIKTICVGVCFIGIAFSNSASGAELDISKDMNENYSNSYIEWSNLSENEKINTDMPRPYFSEVPDSILNDYTIENNPSILKDLLLNRKAGNKLGNVATSVSDSYFNLNNKMNIKVKNQMSTNQCWAFTMLSSLETNIALTSGATELADFSERHMDYATSKTFIDGTNEKGFNREIGDGGLPISALAYLTNGQGAVLEESMPFEDNENKISLNEINKTVDTIVTGYANLPSIIKEYNQDGTVLYSNGSGTYYNNEELKIVRNMIKKHIVDYGGVASFTVGNELQFYNNPANITKSTAYFGNDTSIVRDHAITIVGWDDNYSKDNFNPNNKPSTDGAYIVMNSYGKDAFGDGYLYVSYEDMLIESEIYGITSAEKLDYDNLYQYDEYGGIFSIGTTTTNVGYYANIYQRDASKDEVISNVGVTVLDYVKLEIYLNPNGNITSLDSLVKIGESDGILSPGYHRIDVNETKLTGTCFAIIVKQISENGVFYFAIEANVPNTVYSCVDSNQGQSLVSFDGYNWSDISEINVASIDMAKSDTCVKVFTKVNEQNQDDSEFAIGKYQIDGEYIIKIDHNTTINKFLEEITFDLEIQVLENNETLVTDYNLLVKTGMILKLEDGRRYILIVRGDMDCNGKINLTDISKLILHYHETAGFLLTGHQLKASDLSFDGRTSLLDISQLLVIYNSN